MKWLRLLPWVVVLGCGARETLSVRGYSGASGAGGATSGPGATGVGPGSTGVGVTGTSGPAAGTGGATTGTGPGSGTATASGTGPGTSTGMSSSGTGVMTCAGFGDSCTDCVSNSCPDVWCSCAKNSDCLGLFQCWNGCNGDQVCIQKCMTSFQPGISAALLVTDCAGGPCNGSCQGGMPLDPCSKCIYASCADQANACLAEPECLALYQCLSNCPQLDLMCQKSCYDQHAGGIASLQAMLMCATQQCMPDCGN